MPLAVEHHATVETDRMATRPKIGRPPKPTEELRTTTMHTMLTEDERETFREAARRAGLSVSDWVRTRLLTAARAEMEKPPT